MKVQTPRSGPHDWNDFLRLGERDPRELIDGHLVETEVPKGWHERCVAILCFYLEAWARTHGGGRVLGSGYKVRISNRRGIMPDVQFFRAHRGPLPASGLSGEPPDLVIEVVSESGARYDRVTKLQDYAKIGTPEYWIVDPLGQSFDRLELGNDGLYVQRDRLDGSAVARPATFPGLEIPLEELWQTVRDFPD